MSDLKIPKWSLSLGLWRFMVLAFVLSSTMAYQGCKPSLFKDQTAINNTKDLKVMADRLIGAATGQFSTSKTDVDAFRQKVDDQITYEEGRGDQNKKKVEMWKLLMNPNENLMGGFLKRWESEGSLSAGFVGQLKPIIADNFQKIIDLEEGRPSR